MKLTDELARALFKENAQWGFEASDEQLARAAIAVFAKWLRSDEANAMLIEAAMDLRALATHIEALKDQ